jgi:hypothetical protein
MRCKAQGSACKESQPMPIFYGRTERRLYGFVKYEDQDATWIWIKHYRKYLLLDFLSKNDENFKGREEARRELTHCESLLLRWKYHPNWHEESALREAERMKKMPVHALVMEMAQEEN